MRETLEIGSSPCNEECAQVGQDGYSLRAAKECQAFKNQLIRVFGEPPEGARLKIKGSSHDFGTYYEVAVSFNVENEIAAEYAFKLEGEGPTEWDQEAKTELGI